MTQSLATILQAALQINHLTILPAAQEKLIAYLLLLQKWNHTFNLTRITQVQDMVDLHIIDSLLIQPFLQGKRCLDVGSGAGLPGIPLAIINPQQQWTLLDKNNKKTRFLIQATAQLSLNNVEVIASRCEEFHPLAGFDSILSRAFGTLSFLQTNTKHLLANNGIYIALKGKYPEEELQEIKQHATLLQVVPLTIAGRSVERHLVLFKD